MTLWGCAFEDFLTRRFGPNDENPVEAYLRRLEGTRHNACLYDRVANLRHEPLRGERYRAGPVVACGWAPSGDNVTETVGAMMKLISSAPPEQLAQLSNLLERNATRLPHPPRWRLSQIRQTKNPMCRPLPRAYVRWFVGLMFRREVWRGELLRSRVVQSPDINF
jgi:hypothetical protein